MGTSALVGTGKVVLITGAARGIGRATAIRFAAAGFFVAVADIDEAGAHLVAAEIGASRACAMALDVTDFEQFQRVVQTLGERTGDRLDVFVNNAGLLRFGRFEDISPLECKRQIEVNVLGVVHGIHAALPLLEKTKDSVVVNLGSGTAIYGTPEMAVYSATKFAVRGLTEALDIEFRPKGIRVVDVMPAYVDTEMIRSQTHEPATMKTFGIKLTADDVAESVFRAAHGRALHTLSGIDLSIFMRLAGFSSIARPLARFLTKSRS